MKISSQPNNITFGKVFAIAGNPSQFDELHKIVSSSKGTYGLYSLEGSKLTGEKGDHFVKKAKTMNKKVYVLVAGQEDMDKIILSKRCWTSLQGICNKVTSFINLRNVETDAKPILEAMHKNTKNGTTNANLKCSLQA